MLTLFYRWPNFFFTLRVLNRYDWKNCRCSLLSINYWALLLATIVHNTTECRTHPKNGKQKERPLNPRTRVTNAARAVITPMTVRVGWPGRETASTKRYRGPDIDKRFNMWFQGEMPRGRASPTYDDYEGDQPIRRRSRSRSPKPKTKPPPESGLKLKRKSKNVQNIRSLWGL